MLNVLFSILDYESLFVGHIELIDISELFDIVVLVISIVSRNLMTIYAVCYNCE